MRWLLVTILGLTLGSAARSEDIVDVLRRSQQQRLDAMTPAPDSERAQRVRLSFEKVRQQLQAMHPIPALDFHVITGPVLAETLHGHIVVANVSLADLPEGERLFVLAHELGHVVQHHWLQMGLVYRRWIPGEVTPERTDPVAGPLGKEASGLAHRQEFEADAFALAALDRLGHSPDVAFSAFRLLGMQQDTATHPGTRKRMASLRAAGAP
jgi:hypothetical protein